MKKSIYMGSTKIDPAKTIGEITAVLVRAKARQVSTDYRDGKVEAVFFALDVPGIGMVNFRLPCRTEVLAKEFPRDAAQAERVAWRQVLRWIEAQLAMIDIGMVQPHEVFQPYAMIPGTDKTMFQAWESQMKMLPAPSETK